MSINRFACIASLLAGSKALTLHRIQYSIVLLISWISLVCQPVGARADIAGFSNLHPSVWKYNQRDDQPSADLPNPNVVHLTNGGAGEARSIFHKTPQCVSQFRVTFTYQALNGSINVNQGITFAIQNDPRGSDAIGGYYSSLGYGGGTSDRITKSFAVTLRLDNKSGNFSGGMLGDGLSVSPINLASGHPIDVTLDYDGFYLSTTLVDTVTLASYLRPNIIVGNLATVLGAPTGLVGFTATTNNGVDQYISNFAYTVPHPETEIIGSVPPNGAIDARTPLMPNSLMATGWDEVLIEFDNAIGCLDADGFTVHQEGGNLPAPTIVGTNKVGENSMRIKLNRPIEPRTWTTITHTASDTSVRLGFLPGDVDGNKATTPVDILALIDFLNGIGPSRPVWATDIDRSGLAAPADILQVIDLLNGAGNLESFNGAHLP